MEEDAYDRGYRDGFDGNGNWNDYDDGSPDWDNYEMGYADGDADYSEGHGDNSMGNAIQNMFTPGYLK